MKAGKERSVHIAYSNPPREHHRVMASLAAKYTPSGKVLDIGCGLGYTLKHLHELNPELELFGADMDETCLQITASRVGKVTTIKMRHEACDSTSLGSGYDTCLMGHVLEHTRYPLGVLEAVLSVLRPGGHLILATPNPVRPTVMLSSLLRSHYVNRGHVHAWDRSHWMNFLENISGLDVLEYPVDEVRILPSRFKRPWIIRWLETGLARLLPWWSFSNMAVLRKPEGASEPEPSSHREAK